MFRAFVNPNVGRLNVLLDTVDHLPLFVNQGCQIFEDGVHVDDIRFELPDGALSFAQVFDVLFFLEQELLLLLPGALFDIDLK